MPSCAKHQAEHPDYILACMHIGDHCCECGHSAPPVAGLVDDVHADRLDEVYAKYPNLQFSCCVSPGHGFHTVGCKDKAWTKEELLDALLVKMQFEQDKWEEEKKMYQKIGPTG